MSAEIVYLPITLKDLSHELRTPLTGILGRIHQLKEESLTAQQKSYIEDIQNAGMNLLKLANCLSQAKSLTSLVEDNSQKLIKRLVR